jgi:hypothetical protein
MLAGGVGEGPLAVDGSSIDRAVGTSAEESTAEPGMVIWAKQIEHTQDCPALAAAAV